ncbi:MAG: PIN domain-containing protein [Deltaproteobacteria bacterium]|nr:PIN domain-containing protein [Deltaproteobacteria bacterium]
MICVDTNILVYAHRRDSPNHATAFSKLRELAESGLDWAIPWPCIHEFLAVVTHPRIYRPPSTNEQSVRQIELWMDSPTLRLIGEGNDYWVKLRALALIGKVRGPVFHDARIAAICMECGVTVLWTADRDFSMLPGVRLENPLKK